MIILDSFSIYEVLGSQHSVISRYLVMITMFWHMHAVFLVYNTSVNTTRNFLT